MAEIDVTSFWACLMAGAPPLESFWAYLQTLLQVVGGVLRLNPQVFAAMRGADAITGLSLGVVLVAGLMRMIGQSIVLFANRVRPAGFVVRVLASTLEFILNVLAMGVIVWLVMRVLRPDAGLALGEVLRTIPLAYAPYWLGALVLMPYLGIWIERGLKVYVFLALVVAFRGAFNAPFLSALVGALIAWFSVLFLDSLLSWPLTPATERVSRTLASGREARDDIYQEVYQIYVSVSEPDPAAPAEGSGIPSVAGQHA
jgi:hypothetical protein